MNFYLRNSNYLIDENLSVFNLISSLPNIGNTTAINMCRRFNIEKERKFKELPRYAHRLLKSWLLRNSQRIKKVKYIQKKFIKKLVKINCYKGFRHINGLPVRGQRTHTNSRTKKRNRLLKDMGIGIKSKWKANLARAKAAINDKSSKGADSKKKLKKKKKAGHIKVTRKRKTGA